MIIEIQKVAIDSQKVMIAPKKVAIAPEKVAIDSENPAVGYPNLAIENAINSLEANKNTKSKVLMLFTEFKYESAFGRQDIVLLTGDSQTAAGSLIKKMKNSELIVEVKGQGKGKYCFAKKKN